MTRALSDALFVCVFGVILGLAAALELCEWLFRGPEEEPAPRNDRDPEEWEQLSDEDREYLRWHFK